MVLYHLPQFCSTLCPNMCTCVNLIIIIMHLSLSRWFYYRLQLRERIYLWFCTPASIPNHSNRIQGDNFHMFAIMRNCSSLGSHANTLFTILLDQVLSNVLIRLIFTIVSQFIYCHLYKKKVNSHSEITITAIFIRIWYFILIQR